MRQRSRVRYPVRPHTFVSLSSDSRRAVVSYWRKYVYEVLVNHLEGLSLPRKSVIKLTDRPDMTIDVYRGRKTTTQQRQQNYFICSIGVQQSIYFIELLYCYPRHILRCYMNRRYSYFNNLSSHILFNLVLDLRLAIL